MILEAIKRKGDIYAFKKIGHFVTADRVNKKGAKWIVKLKVDYPLIIRDDSNPNKYIRKFVRLLDIGDLVYSKEGSLIDFPTRDECSIKVQNRLAFWYDELEKIIVTTSSFNLAKIDRLRNFWNPIYFVVSNLIDDDKISFDDLDSVTPSNIYNYIDLLINLKLVKKEGDLITYTPLFSLKFNKYGGDEKEFRDWVVSYVIQNRYRTIKDVFNITQLMRIIRTENVYYQPSLNAEELLHKSLYSLTSDYSNWYGKVSYLDVKYWLKELMDVGLIIKRNNFYYGNEEIFEDMIDYKKKLPDRIPPLINIPK